MTTISMLLNDDRQISILSALAESWNVSFTITEGPREFTPLLQQSINDAEAGNTIRVKDSDELMQRIYAEVPD